MNSLIHAYKFINISLKVNMADQNEKITIKFDGSKIYNFYVNNKEYDSHVYVFFKKYFGDNEWVLSGTKQEVESTINSIMEDSAMDCPIARLGNAGLLSHVDSSEDDVGAQRKSSFELKTNLFCLQKVNMTDRIEEIDTQIQTLEKEKKDIQAEELKQLLEPHDTLWAVIATPSDSHHCKHIVAYFTARELAESAIGNGSSYDDDEHITWHYTIKEELTTDVSEGMKQNVNKTPSHFPYSGW